MVACIIGITLLFTLSEASVAETNNDWLLVFKGVTGGHGSIYDLFLSGKTRNSYVLEAKVLNNTYPGHYKSDILNYWDDMDITQVRVGVYRGSEQKAFFTFNAIGADRTDWFAKDKLMNTSYHDLLDPSIEFKHFSIEGDTSSRRFFVNTKYGGCQNDEGWFVVKDAGARGSCKWETDHAQETPTILFSPHSKISQFQNEGEDWKADFMTISVQFGYNSLFNDYSTCETSCSQPDDTAASASSASSAPTTTPTATTTTPSTTTTTPSTTTPSTTTTTPSTTTTTPSTTTTTPSTTTPSTTTTTPLTTTPSTTTTTPSTTTTAPTTTTPSTTTTAPTTTTTPKTTTTAPTTTAPSTTTTAPTTTTTPPKTTTTASPTEQPIDMATLTKQMDEIKEKLTVPKQSTSAHKRSKISAPDHRQSAKNMGIIGIVLLLAVGLLIVVPDAARLAVALHGAFVRPRTVDTVHKLT